jgi:hypothetical protein
MLIKQLRKIWNEEVNAEFDEKEAQNSFKNFSEEFVKVYQDIEADEHLFVGSVTMLEE